jgi:GntR family transcriptional regulator, transcriptional repressor for pyruvate dehydrogenase complex
MVYKPMRRSGLSEDIAQRILTLIREKQLLPGVKLPSEQELTDMLDVSRPSLREAMRALAFINVVEIRQGDGTYVTSLKPELLVEHLELFFSIEDASFLQLLEARMVVEPSVAAIAAGTITEDELVELEATIAHAQQSRGEIPTYVEFDVQFHTVIVQAAGNPLLSRFMASIAHLDKVGRIQALIRMSADDYTHSIQQVYADHQEIVAALRAHDAERARLAMVKHLTNVELDHRNLHQHNSDYT